MLKLSRRVGERLVFTFRGEPVGTIEVADASGGRKVSLALDLHPDLKVMREELVTADAPTPSAA